MLSSTRYLLTVLLLMLAASGAFAQKHQTISVSSSGEAELPADIINFRINLNAEGETSQKAYDKHRKLEDELVDLLEEHEIEEKHIYFRPINIHEVRGHPERETPKSVRTQQRVQLRLDDFDVYEKIQVKLIEAGFDQFNGDFASSNQKEGEKEALKKAIANAREKAELIASELGGGITGIQNIQYGESPSRPGPVYETQMARSADESGNLMNYRQTVMVRTSISIDFTMKTE